MTGPGGDNSHNYDFAWPDGTEAALGRHDTRSDNWWWVNGAVGGRTEYCECTRFKYGKP